MATISTSTAQISCIKKNPREDRYNAITHVGGVLNKRWQLTLDEAIGHIEGRRWTFYTMANGHRADVVVASRNGRKYLKTTADYDTPDNLLSLPECP
jgi:predicted double-glycine peptidase